MVAVVLQVAVRIGSSSSGSSSIRISSSSSGSSSIRISSSSSSSSLVAAVVLVVLV